jgi:ribosome maturation factor RimP
MGILPDDIERRLREEVERRGLVLLELKRRGERGSTVIEIIIDSETADVNLDELAEVNRWASDLFDEIEEELPSRYRIEVSTPGLGRPLDHLWQYRKNVGRLVKVSYRDETDVVRSDLFRLVEVAGTTLILAPKGRKKGNDDGSVVVELDHIVKAVVEPEF